MNDSSIFDLGYLKKGKKKLEQAWRKESFCPDDLSYISSLVSRLNETTSI